MTHIERGVTISAPLADVFAYASDYQRWPEWFEGVSEFVPTTAIIRGTGARYAYTVRLFGMAVGVETEICDFEINRRWRGKSTKGIPSSANWDFQPFGAETRFVYTLEYHLPLRWISSFPDRLVVKPQWERIIEHSLENLRRHFLGKVAMGNR
jgi:uncharacterized membrane protein